ncbi:conjugal transfer protein TraU [Azohydromonas australica]|uniref:conjugal transfer protein TraU n=1 Tax=Azohydromonas australica TaxID=364039 RepID=UPI000421F62D|nr:conjugal transfer protein TraU [Azohydromonas australica]
MPGILEKGAAAVESLLAHVGRYLIGRDMASYCELVTALPLSDDDLRRMPGLQDPYVLVTDANALVTVFDLQGSYQLTSAQDFAAIVDNLRVKMNGYMARPGHSLSIGFERDPERAHDELMRLAEPLIKTARRIGLHSEDIILDRVRRNAPLVAYEQNLMVLYTHMNVMSDDEAKRELKERVERALQHQLPYLDFGQNPAAVLLAMKYRHDTMVARVKQDFEQCGQAGTAGIMLKPIGAHEAIKRLRIMVNRERTSQKFRPVLPGDRFFPHGREDARDFSDLSAPLIGYQISTTSVDIEGELIRSEDLWHANLSLELGPQEPQPFGELFRNVDRRMPWRMRLDLCPGGLNEMRGRQMMLAFAGMFPSNKMIKQSFQDLLERSRHDAILSMKVTASTWGHSEHEAKQRAASLEKALQAWGTCQVTDVHGDPMAAWASTIPAFTTRNIANRWVPPLDDALLMAPLQRPATPWSENGTVVMRTPDGKIFPIQPGSRLQDTWIELGAAPPGSGKTTLMNSINNALLHNPGSARLPLMTMVEVKPGSAGLIQLIQDSLPQHRRHEAIYLRLRNDPEYAVNIWDTQLGARRPTAREFDFQTDFMTALCSDAKSRSAPGDCARVNEMLLNVVYGELAQVKANTYEMGVERVVDEALSSSGLRASHDAEDWWLHATWYEVTDMLFAHGLHREAALAQRHASPVLTDFIAALQHESVVGLYGTAMVGQERLLDYMARCFHSASSSYRLFAGRTRFEISSETRVVGMDLNEVIGGKSDEGMLRTGIMYMFARYLAARNYFLREDLLLPIVPPLYREYHRQRVADIRDEKKHISYDEFHNTGGLAAFTSTIIKDGREGREWGIRIAAFSQFLADFPDDLLGAATCVYVMRGGSPGDERVLREKFDVSEEAIRRLQRDAVGPNAEEGGNFLALFKTKRGFVVQMLTNTVGAVEAWAFSTTSEDVSLRTRLYEALGTYAARKLLAHHFPLGTATETIERMRADAPEGAQGSVVAQLASRLLHEHASQQRNQQGGLQ